jgi:hypothetical protein
MIPTTLIPLLFSNIQPYISNARSKTNNCPSITPMSTLNISEYIRASWYIQEQQITSYQPENTLYCVTQTLNETNNTVPLFSGPVIDVYNYGNVGSAIGPQENENNFTLCAREVNISNHGMLLNGPCFLPNNFAGPYWVIAAGPRSNNYTWAIVSGGPPTVRYQDGNCSTSLHGMNGSGLWLFTRNSYGQDVNYLTGMMRDMLRQFGYSVSQLLDVVHRNCSYTGAYIKY